jgi:20S proteasome alpha/beta subunit
LKPNVRKGKNDNLGIVDSNFTAAMAPYLMSSIVGIKVPSFIITAAEKIRAAINNNGPEVKKIKFTDGQRSFLKI